ncbi:MAG: pilus assembly protein TadG-related protein [Candidatus Nanopelagicales bacterium]
MKARTACNARERGSILVLGIGLMGVCLLAVAVVTDTTSAFLQRRHLYSLADSAALAAVQVVDLPSYYASGASAGTRLQPSSVVAKAKQHIREAQALTPIEGLEVDGVSSDGITARVDLSAPVRLPFLGALRSDLIRVSSTARLDYRPSP